MYASTIHLPVEQQLSLAVRLFTKLRWIPPVVIVIGGAGLNFGFGLTLNLSALAQISAAILLYNLYLIWRDRRTQPTTISDLLRSANLHMFFDYLSLTLLLYYTGGALSPIVWFYSIHIIMACIFFKRSKAIWTTTFLWLVVCMLLIGEYLGWWPHQVVYSPTVEKLFREPGYLFSILAGSAVFWAAIIILTTLIIDRVRSAEHEERKLQIKYKQLVDDLTDSEKKRELYRRSMTHELRSPIAAAQSLIRIMAAGAFGPLSEKQLDSVQRVSTRLDQMMDMLQDLLTLERAGRTEFKYEPIPLSPLIEKILANSQPQLDERRIRVTLLVDNSAVALADPDDIKMIFSNLISNAIKYNRDDGLLRVVATNDDQYTQVSITDSGIGIPKRDQERLFAEFFRAANAKERTTHGTGLGLAIVKNLIAQNNGVISLESEENSGTTVVVTLPKAPTDWISTVVG